VNEWRRVVIQGAIWIAFMELFEIGRLAFTDGWSGVRKFHFRWNRLLLAHCIGSVVGGVTFGILMVFGWRAFRGAPLAVLVALFAPALVALPFRSSIRNFFRDQDAPPPVKAHELPFPR